MEWSFKYIGPKSPVDDRDCRICATVARKRCQQHSNYQSGCTHCDAVRDASCPAHCGVELALNRHNVAVSDPSNFEWVPVGSVTVGEMAGGATFGTQERRETRMTQAKADRIRQAHGQFSAAGAYILAQCALLPECRVDITAKGDTLGKLANLELVIVAFGNEQTVDDSPEVAAPQLGVISAQSPRLVGKSE